ncbi:TPA: hypothetical protein ACWX6N_005533, partial [Klebsiella pneumoniae]
AGKKDKEFFLNNGTPHIETYWVRKYVDQTVQKLDLFFHKNILLPSADTLAVQAGVYPFS